MAAVRAEGGRKRSMKKIRNRITLFLVASVFIFATLIPASALPQPPSVILSIMVYIIDGNTNYHRSICGIVYDRRTEQIPLAQAYKEGYRPCSYCKPPHINGL